MKTHAGKLGSVYPEENNKDAVPVHTHVCTPWRRTENTVCEWSERTRNLRTNVSMFDNECILLL